MSYKVISATESIEDSMKLLRGNMKGMPNKEKYRPAYRQLRRAIAQLKWNMEEGERHFRGEWPFP